MIFYKVYKYINFIGAKDVKCFISEDNARIYLNERRSLYPHFDWYLSEVHPKDSP